MLQSVIDSASNIIFLGAGASRPLEKMLMNEFIVHLQNKPYIYRFALFSDIIEKINDLEFLLEQLQEIEGKDYLRYSFSTQISAPRVGSQLGRERPESSSADLAGSAVAL